MLNLEELTQPELHAVALGLFTLEEFHAHQIDIVPASIRQAISDLRVQTRKYIVANKLDPEILR